MAAKSSHTSLLLPACVVVIITTTLLISNHSTTPPPVSITPTQIPTPTSEPEEGLLIDPTKVKVGDKFGSLVLREIKPFTGTSMNYKSNISITFQGEVLISGNFLRNNCFEPEKISSTLLLPRFLNTKQPFELCFTNAEKITKKPTESILIDNFTLINNRGKYSYTATFIKSK